MKRIAVILLLLSSLLLGACGARAEEPYAVSLWYAEDDPMAPALVEAAEQYNQNRSREALSLRLRSFPDSEQLAAALDTARPDLLLCDHARALDLYERGLLTSLRAETSLSDRLCARSESFGVSVFPLGAQVTLLYARSGKGQQTDLITLCEDAARQAREQRLPQLEADAFAPLFCQALLDRGVEFHADGGREIYTEAYRQVYNSFAGAIYDGGLIHDTRGGAALVQGGYVPRALVDSASLADAEETGYAFLLPTVNGERLAALRCLVSFAAPGRQANGAAQFLSWLYEGERLGALALDRGLVPVTPAPEAGDALADTLRRAAADSLYLPGADSDYGKNRSGFEARFLREAAFLQ